MMTFDDSLRDGSCCGKLARLMVHFPSKFMPNISFSLLLVIFAYGLQFTYVKMPGCFFRQSAFRFRENRSHNIEESLNSAQ